MSAAAYDGAIANSPRDITEHPLLEDIYARHDRLLGCWIRGRTLEVACGTHTHADADFGIDIFAGNCRAVDGDTAVADARELPFRDGAFDTIVGRRFIHHVPPDQRSGLLAELNRVCSPEGRLVLLEGTPGYYRLLTKGLGFALGILGDDEDEYGHCRVRHLLGHLDRAGFEIETAEPIGSVLMPLAILRRELPSVVPEAVERTQWVRWWTLVVARPTFTEGRSLGGGRDGV